MNEFFSEAFGNGMLAQYGEGLLTTLYLVALCALLSYAIGIPVGVILCVTDGDGIRPRRTVNRLLGFVVNVLRSVPFMILLVVALPLTKALLEVGLGERDAGTMADILAARDRAAAGPTAPARGLILWETRY